MIRTGAWLLSSAAQRSLLSAGSCMHAQDIDEIDMFGDEKNAGGTQQSSPVQASDFRMHSRLQDGPMQRTCAPAETADDPEVRACRGPAWLF